MNDLARTAAKAPRGLHIAFVHQDFPYSGAERVTALLADGLCAHGYRVTVLAVRHHEQLSSAGHRPRYEVASLPEGSVKSSRNVAAAIARYVASHQVDVLVTYRELFYAQRLKRETGVRMVYVLHNSPFYECLDLKEKAGRSKAYRLLWRLSTSFYRLKYRRVYGWADAYGVLCDGYKDEIERILHLDAEHNKVRVLPNPITMPPAVRQDKRQTVLYVGRLSHRDKRVDRLLRIWQEAQPQMPGWQLKLVGSGREEEALRAMARRMGLRNVSFEGSTADVQPYYDEAAILCLTSTFEGWPMAVAEAQASGVIPIVFDSFAGARTMIASDAEGILVPPFDEAAFASRLVALASDQPRLKKMRRAVTAKAATYSLQRSVHAWEDMLNAIMHDKR